MPGGGQPPRRRSITIGVCCTALAVVLASGRRGFAVCNVIPGTTQTFRATQTTVDRPFASPGDFVALGLDPTCYPIPRTFSTTPGDQVIKFIHEALARHHGNISKAAEDMGMYRQHLELKLAEYGIDAAAYRER